jgi:hypothetical protein
MALAYRLDAISQGSKNSRIPFIAAKIDRDGELNHSQLNS